MVFVICLYLTIKKRLRKENFIAGGTLAGKKYKEIEPELERFGYKKLSL